MKKITKKNKIRVPGSWEDIGMEIYWHPKSDYIFLLRPISVRKSDDLEPIGEFGKLKDPVIIKIDKRGNAKISNMCPFDLAVLKLKLDYYGFKNYEIKESVSKNKITNTLITLKTKDEKAMFQVYFSDFIK